MSIEITFRDRANVAIIEEIETNLAAAGLDDARVDLTLTRRGDEILKDRGVFTVTPPNSPPLIYKRYEVDAGREREILSATSGIVSPNIHTLGETFHLVEQLDPKVFTPIDLIADSGQVDHAVQAAAIGLGRLAQSGIQYGDTHFLDEIFMTEEGHVMIVDLGRARWFNDATWSDHLGIVLSSRRTKTAKSALTGMLDNLETSVPELAELRDSSEWINHQRTLQNALGELSAHFELRMSKGDGLEQALEAVQIFIPIYLEQLAWSRI